MALKNDPRVVLFYATVTILFLVALGCVVVSALAVQSERAKSGAAGSTAVAMLIIGSTALFASIVLFVAYLWSTWNDGNWLSKTVDKIRGVPKEFARRKLALRHKLEDRAIQQLMDKASQRVNRDNLLGKARASEKQKIVAALWAAYNAAPNKNPEEIAAAIDAQSDLSPDQVVQAQNVLADIEREAKEIAQKELSNEEAKAIAQKLPPPPPPVASSSLAQSSVDFDTSRAPLPPPLA